jgi:hypothetical protein
MAERHYVRKARGCIQDLVRVPRQSETALKRSGSLRRLVLNVACQQSDAPLRKTWNTTGVASMTESGSPS